MTASRLAAGIALGFGLAIGAATPAAAALTYEFQCFPLYCAVDPSFTASFSFAFAGPAEAAGLVTTAADPRFLGWTTSDAVGNGYNLAGNGFLQNGNADIQFTFSPDGRSIVDLQDTSDLGQFIDIGTPTENTSFFEGYYVDSRIDDGAGDFNLILGRFELPQAEVPEPAAAALLATGMLGLLATRRRKEGKPCRAA